ncbi:hypothetical protein Rt10032_c03g1313 [Rhodotorula toruloides]|uniref:Uncharacterized protein n=1 Tax=Rhodotorula toruloides TaxID=5286 RepID=A0A511KBI9_RHOTO|nr:hypothetical protein Rt10032_c03g1313 [Rhodotorula toruloides]
MHGRAQRADVFHEETKSTAYRSKVDANILPPAYRSAIATEWAHGLSGSCAELEDIYWLFDGWDELADQLYLEWAAHVSEVDAVRRAFNEFNPEKKVFVSREAGDAYYDQLMERNEGLSGRAQKLRDRFQGRLPPPNPFPQWRSRQDFDIEDYEVDPTDRRYRHCERCRKYRSLATRARLAIDVITFDSQAAAISKDQAVENLRRREAELRGKLADVFKNRPKASAEEQLINDETRLKADLRVHGVKTKQSKFRSVHE